MLTVIKYSLKEYNKKAKLADWYILRIFGAIKVENMNFKQTEKNICTCQESYSSVQGHFTS